LSSNHNNTQGYQGDKKHASVISLSKNTKIRLAQGAQFSYCGDVSIRETKINLFFVTEQMISGTATRRLGIAVHVAASSSGPLSLRDDGSMSVYAQKAEGFVISTLSRTPHQ